MICVFRYVHLYLHLFMDCERNECLLLCSTPKCSEILLTTLNYSELLRTTPKYAEPYSRIALLGFLCVYCRVLLRTTPKCSELLLTTPKCTYFYDLLFCCDLRRCSLQARCSTTVDSRRGSLRVCSLHREVFASAASRLRGSSLESAN